MGGIECNEVSAIVKGSSGFSSLFRGPAPADRAERHAGSLVATAFSLRRKHKVWNIGADVVKMALPCNIQFHTYYIDSLRHKVRLVVHSSSKLRRLTVTPRHLHSSQSTPLTACTLSTLLIPSAHYNRGSVSRNSRPFTIRGRESVACVEPPLRHDSGRSKKLTSRPLANPQGSTSLESNANSQRRRSMYIDGKKLTVCLFKPNIGVVRNLVNSVFREYRGV
jgi:hypothetical protein